MHTTVLRLAEAHAPQPFVSHLGVVMSAEVAADLMVMELREHAWSADDIARLLPLAAARSRQAAA